MTWNLHAPQGHESAKVRYDVLPYCARGGLDIGCGPAKVWPNMIGVDSGKDTGLFGIEMNPDIVVNTAERLPMFADGAFECVFSSHTLEHIDDWQAALTEWWRLVKVGGTLALYLPHADLYPNIGQPGANPDHKHDFRPDDIVGHLAAAFPDWSLLVCETRAGGNEYSFLIVARKEVAGHGQARPCDAPKPAKTAGIVRVGAYGDALWASSPIALMKKQGYHVTAYVAATGEEVLRHDPNIDRLVALPNGVLDDEAQIEYYAHEAAKFDKWVNLIGSVEQRLLYHPSSNEFYLPQALRHRFGNHNYLEMIHDYADLPHEFNQRFYPTPAERAWAKQARAGLLAHGAARLVVLNPCGSGPAKTWPHAQSFMQRMADAGIACAVLGDTRDLDLQDIDPAGVVIGKALSLRAAFALALEADVVVGTESAIINAVAFEPMLKVALLSHSSAENLTKHWRNTAAIEPTGVSCHPCHRIHGAHLGFCAKDTATGCAACMAAATADAIADFVIDHLALAEAA